MLVAAMVVSVTVVEVIGMVFVVVADAAADADDNDGERIVGIKKR